MIKVQSLCKRFGAKVAVDQVSFTVEKGEVLGFLGPNGAGKSTTMRMITGYIAPDAGKVTINGHDLETHAIQAKALIGYLPENAPSYEDMTVESFLGFIASMRAMHGQRKREAVERVIATCHLEPVRFQSIDTLSKGYRHRTGLAQALIHDPPILVLDEPTDGLDPNQKFEVRNLIRRMGETKAIILSTHILEEVDAVCSRVVIIDRGKIQANGLPSELKAKSTLAGAVTLWLRAKPFNEVQERLQKIEGVAKVLHLGDEGGLLRVRAMAVQGKEVKSLAPLVAEACQQAGWAIHELHTEAGRLDEVFRAITTSEGAAK